MKDTYLFVDQNLAAVDSDRAYDEARERAAGFFDDESEAAEDEKN